MLAQSVANVAFEVFGQRLIAFMTRIKDNERLDDFTALLIRHANHGAFGNGVVLEQAALYIERTDTIARGRDHIIAAPDKTDGAIFILLNRIASQIIVAHPALTLDTQITIEEEQRRVGSMYRQCALRTLW